MTKPRKPVEPASAPAPTLETISPEQAHAMLKTGSPHDRWSEDRVAGYAAEMRAGRWETRPDSFLTFDRDGNLADGRHRLLAIAKAGISLKIYVQRLKVVSPAVTNIAAQIEAAKARLAELGQLQIRLAAMSVEDEKVEAQYRQCIENMVATEGEIIRLQKAALGVEQQRREQAVADAGRGRRAAFADFETALEKRFVAVEELCHALEQASAAFVKFTSACDLVARSVPPGCGLPAGAQISQLEVTVDGKTLSVPAPMAISSELYRIAPNFPGAKSPTVTSSLKPAPMTDSARRQNTWIVDHVRQQVERAETAEQQKDFAA